MTPKMKASELLHKYFQLVSNSDTAFELSKQLALIAVENEYHSLRELLFNLRSCKVIDNGRVYTTRLQQLIDEEQQVKTHIEQL